MKKLSVIGYQLSVIIFCSIAFATVPATLPPSRTVCDGNMVEFSFNFPIKQTSDIVVTRWNHSTDAETTLTQGLNYTVSAMNEEYFSGGTVTTITIYPAGDIIVIDRATTLTQETHFIEGGIFPAGTVESALDNAIFQVQDRQVANNRNYHIPRTDPTATSTQLPSTASRAGKIFGFDANGNPIMLPNTYTIADTNIPVSSYMRDVVNDVNAAEARRTLGVPSSGIPFEANQSMGGNRLIDLPSIPVENNEATPMNWVKNGTFTFTGKTYKDPNIDGNVAGSGIDTDGNLAGNSDVKLASQKAIKTYAYNKSDTNSIIHAWVVFDGTGTVAIRSSYGVSSVNDVGTGTYIITWSTPFIDANYALMPCSKAYLTGSGTMVDVNNGQVPLTTSVTIAVYDDASNKRDVNYVSVTAIGR